MELTTIGRGSDGYPPLLAQIHDPPAKLYVRGDFESLSRPAVAVVGARSCSSYGAQVARDVARELAASGMSSAGSRAASTARRIAGRSRRAGRRSPSSAAGSTATTRAAMRLSRSESVRAAL
jgi:hypothetical protein